MTSGEATTITGKVVGVGGGAATGWAGTLAIDTVIGWVGVRTGALTVMVSWADASPPELLTTKV